MKTLTIRHNHGDLVLKNTTLVPYDYEGRTFHTAHGTVESGGVTNRLFSAHSYTPFHVGDEMDYPIYGKTPRCIDQENDAWDVSVQHCG